MTIILIKKTPHDDANEVMKVNVTVKEVSRTMRGYFEVSMILEQGEQKYHTLWVTTSDEPDVIESVKQAALDAFDPGSPDPSIFIPHDDLIESLRRHLRGIL